MDITTLDATSAKKANNNKKKNPEMKVKAFVLSAIHWCRSTKSQLSEPAQHTPGPRTASDIWEVKRHTQQNCQFHSEITSTGSKTSSRPRYQRTVALLLHLLHPSVPTDSMTPADNSEQGSQSGSAALWIQTAILPQGQSNCQIRAKNEEPIFRYLTTRCSRAASVCF